MSAPRKAPKPIEAVHASIGLAIRRIREVLGMDQGSLAKAVGLTRTSITNIEAGRQRIILDDVESFARALGTTPKHLMKGIWW
jgi:transcriptional regulator with XRE-family HTH domain